MTLFDDAVGRILMVVAATSLAVSPAQALADDAPDVREAGDGDRFRIVDRFPDDEEDGDSTVELPTVDGDTAFGEVVELVEQRDWEAAASHLESAPLAEAVDEDPEKRFLAGYVALQTEDFDRAFELLNGLEDRPAPLRDYVAYHTAEAALGAGDAHRATLAAARVPSTSRLHVDALELLAEALVEAGEKRDRQRAVEVLEILVDEADSRDDAARYRRTLAETLESLNRTDEATEVYLAIRDHHPLGDETDEAKQRLEALRDKLDDELAARIDDDSIDRAMRRFRRLHDLHKSERIIDELPDRLEAIREESTTAFCEALYIVADSHTKLRRHTEAIEWYDRVVEECADVEDYEIRGLYRTARSRWNADQNDRALEVWEQIWTDYPDHSFADDAMHFSARILRSEGRDQEFRQMLRRQVERYPEGDKAKDGHWLIVRDLLERENYSDVVDYVDGLDRTGEDDLYTRGRLRYFRARALERAGETDRARRGFVSVLEEYSKSYYALLAFNRLAEIDAPSTDRVCDGVPDLCDRHLGGADGEPASIEVPDRLRNDDRFERGSLLLALGLVEPAREEFSALRRDHADDDRVLWALADLLDEAGAHVVSHNLARRHIDGWRKDDSTPSARTRWTIAYPTPFSAATTRWADRREGVDTARVYAVMREESGFDPRIESWANATGLLQLLDDTARRMATRDGLDSFSVSRLVDPETNIRLGTAYMEHLGERLGPHPALIAAGYNGGAGNVSEWLDQFGDLGLDLFVEEIPFHQTRQYTKRVLRSYWMYSVLHGDRRVPNLAFDLRDS